MSARETTPKINWFEVSIWTAKQCSQLLISTINISLAQRATSFTITWCHASCFSSHFSFAPAALALAYSSWAPLPAYKWLSKSSKNSIKSPKWWEKKQTKLAAKSPNQRRMIHLKLARPRKKTMRKRLKTSLRMSEIERESEQTKLTDRVSK